MKFGELHSMRYANRQDSILRLPLSDFELAKSAMLEWQCVTVPYDGQPSVRFSYQKQFYRLDDDEWPTRSELAGFSATGNSLLRRVSSDRILIESFPEESAT